MTNPDRGGLLQGYIVGVAIVLGLIALGWLLDSII